MAWASSNIKYDVGLKKLELYTAQQLKEPTFNGISDGMITNDMHLKRKWGADGLNSLVAHIYLPLL